MAKKQENPLTLTLEQKRINKRKADNRWLIERRLAYPPIADQLDAIMKWLATENEFSIPAELKSIAMSCMSVKARFPKPEENDD